MHGRPRQKPGAAQDPERVKAAQKKAALFGQLSQEVLSRRAAKRYDSESLGLAAKLLELHPEVYTVWNYRREALAPVLDAGGEPAVAAVAAELALTERALHRNPKSYAAWHHRRWVVAKGFCSLEHELALVGKLLDADERNFHGWGYRRFVVQLMGTPAARELEYAEHKINQNFSNYSAWHSRTALLPVLYGGADGALGEGAGGEGEAEAARVAAELLAALAGAARLDEGQAAAAAGAAQEQEQPAAEAAEGGQQETSTAAAADMPQEARQQQHEGKPAGAAGAEGAAAAPAASPASAAATSAAAVPQDALDAEYELVKQAFFTEPEDQSGWFYHRWLLGCSLAHWERARGMPEEEAGERSALLALLAREGAMCQDLLEIEPDAKWPLLTLTRLQELEQQVLAAGGSASSAVGTSADSGSGSTGGGGASAAAGGGGAGGLAAEVAEGYARLLELDPLRAGYYRDARDGRAHVVARPSAAAS